MQLNILSPPVAPLNEFAYIARNLSAARQQTGADLVVGGLRFSVAARS